MMGVAATGSDDAHHSYPGEEFSVDVEAMVVSRMLTTSTTGSPRRKKHAALEKSSGTSMAAPLVAGAAALYLEKYPTAKPSDVARALTTTATAVTWDDGREEVGGGGGMLDLEAMLRVAPG